MKCCILSALVCWPLLTSGQLVNANFEAPEFDDLFRPLFDPGGGLPYEPTRYPFPWELAAPGWQHTSGDDTGHVLFHPHVGISQMFQLGVRFSDYDQGELWFEGEFCLYLQSGYADNMDLTSPWIDAAIWQEVDLPLGTLALTFKATGPFEVTFAGQFLSAAQTDEYNFRVDLTQVAGRSGELRFTKSPFPPEDDPLYDYIHGIDSIAFQFAVPEPAAAPSIGLACLGALGCVRRRRS